MMDWYFPQEVHEAAHLDYLERTGISADELRQYCLEHIEFFFDVSFAYVENRPLPIMEK